jgi:hypothetical protein
MEGGREGVSEGGSDGVCEWGSVWGEVVVVVVPERSE